MGYTHRDNAQFSRAKWRKRLLLPCWIIQIIILLGVMGLFAYRLSRTIRMWKEDEDMGRIPMVEFVWEAVNIAFSMISLIIVIISIARFIAEVLTPLPLLFANILNLALSSGVLALDIVVYVQHADREYSLIGLAMDGALMLFTIIPAIYSVVIYRRLLSYDDYHIAGNVKPYGYASTEEPEDTAYRSSWLDLSTPYDPTNPSSSASRPRSHSGASRRISILGSRPSTPLPSPPLAEPVLERRASYDHRRDTQFDEYVRRKSNTYSRADVEQALGVEFGWRESAEAQRESVVSLGTVAVAKSRPRGDSLSTRQASVEASISRNGSNSTTVTSATSVTNSSTASTLEPAQDGMIRAHSLNSVPEAHEEEDKDRRAAAAAKKMREDQEALLGQNRSSRSSSGSSRRSSRRIDPVEGLEEVELENKMRTHAL